MTVDVRNPFRDRFIRPRGVAGYVFVEIRYLKAL